MKIIKGLKNFNALKHKGPVVVAIGTFDGVHIAHKRIIKKAASIAARLNGVSVVMTFYPHPMRITNPNKSPALLTSIEHRVGLISQLNPDICLIVDFKKSFAGMRPQDFIDKILLGQLRATQVVIGKNFNFGRNKSGNIKFLKSAAQRGGFKVDAIESVKSAGKVISSSFIRSLIENGRLHAVSKLLGRRFSVQGTVVKGDSRGKVLG
ncbi:MAG: adenylyltransferase/cytidyltransferase family protein, partial [Candidatus Omnitrophica bacterium]|nr:adenylyltransferase/cytidyltransferase family protein [Candidatus Omnitrophota bacterium]